jgi:hypothetical protein
MLRRRKDIDWESVFPPEDLVHLWSQVDVRGWYPMATFERFGLAILDHLKGTTLEAVRFWGRFSASTFWESNPELVVEGEPVESLMRLKVIQRTLFDFPAFDMPMLAEGHAYVTIAYLMSPRAEEAASHQTMGFCEGVLSLAGVITPIESSFKKRAWQGDDETLLELTW